MTPARIAELRALCEAATEGPWRADTLTENRMNPNSPVFECVSNRHGQVLFRAHLVSYRREPDAAFIAAARTALPEALDFIGWLCDELADLKGDLRAAEEREEKLRTALSELVDCCLSEDDGYGEGSPVDRAMKALARAALSGAPGK